LSCGWFEVDLLPSCCLLKGAKRQKVGRKSRGGKGEEALIEELTMEVGIEQRISLFVILR